MSQTYVVERKVEYWTSRQIEDIFSLLGHDIDVFPQSMLEEKQRPADFIFSSNTLLKVFGLQYKALYHQSYTDDHWRIYSRQHKDLQKYNWIYYAFSEVKAINERNSALHLCRFINPICFKSVLGSSKQYEKINDCSVRKYRRWGGFYKGLLKCDIGKRISSEKEYSKFLKILNSENFKSILSHNNIDLFFTDFTSRKSIKYSASVVEPKNFTESEESDE